MLDSRLPFSVLQLCRQCLRPAPWLIRPLSTSSTPYAETPTTLGDFGQKILSDEDAPEQLLKSLFGNNYKSDMGIPNSSSSTSSSSRASSASELDLGDLMSGSLSSRQDPPHHLHVYATKHNTHITLTDPDHSPRISKSAGNIGFRKSARGTYDAAYQLSAFVLSQIYEGPLMLKIKRLEIVLRGFGVGREAVSKALLGAEGRRLRPMIASVTDTTRLKFGGTRSRKPRRLG